MFFINIQGSRKVFLKLVPSALAVAAQEQVVLVPDCPKAAVLHSPNVKNVGVLIVCFVGSRTGALLRRFSLAVSPRFLWECLTRSPSEIRFPSLYPLPALVSLSRMLGL